MRRFVYLFCLLMHKFALSLRSWNFFFRWLGGEVKRFCLGLGDSMSRVFDLNQDQGIRSKAEVESSIVKRGLLRGGECGLAV